jgi:acyl-coenzyme A thioesterase PaaI-like protein
MTDGTADWLNDTSEYQRCFVCGQQNPFGLQLAFHNEGDRIVTDFQPEARHQGFPGVVHGGILAAILDETMGRVPVLEHRWVMTGRLDLRYRAPALITAPLRCTAEATDNRARLVKVRGWLARIDDPNVIVCEAEGLFLPLPDSVRQEAITQWPGLQEFFS